MTLLTEELLNVKSSEERDQLLMEILNRNQINELVSTFFSKDTKAAQKASWLLQKLTDIKPDELHKSSDFFVQKITTLKSDAQKRFVMRYFMTQPLPKSETDLAKLLNQSFDWLSDPSESIATRANAITVIYRISEIIPEIKGELILILEEHSVYGSAGFKNRAMHTLRKLRKKSK